MSWTPPTVDARDEPTFNCPTCLDCGWELEWCVGIGDDHGWERPQGYRSLPARPCGRPKPHHRHTYASRCVCWLTNPVIQRRRDMEAERRSRRDDAA